MIIKGGSIVAALMGDPNASIPTPQPVHYRPMFGAFGRARTASSVVFASKAAVKAGLGKKLGIQKELVAVANTRGGISKKSMIHNDATPRHRGRSRNLRGARRRRAADLRAGRGAADGAALFSVLAWAYGAAPVQLLLRQQATARRRLAARLHALSAARRAQGGLRDLRSHGRVAADDCAEQGASVVGAQERPRRSRRHGMPSCDAIAPR